MAQGSKGWRSRESARLYQCGPGSNPGLDTICGLSLLLVLSFAPRSFSPGTPVFPSPQKPTFPNSSSTRNQVDEEPLCGYATSKSLFIYLFIFTKPNLWSTNALLYVLVKNWKRQIISELFLIAVFLSPDFHRHRICEPSFFSGIRSRLRGLSVA